MALSDNPFVGFTLVELTELRDAFKQGILDIATTGSSYQINGRQFTAENLAEMKKTLFDINQAIGKLNGTGNPSYAVGHCRYP